MELRRYDNQAVDITAVYFRRRGQGTLESYPKRMLIEGQEYTFGESAMRYLIRQGQALIQLFDVSDGQRQYRLRLDEQQRWTLVGMKAVA